MRSIARPLAGLALFCAPFALASCSSLDFDVTEPIPAQTVQGSPLGGVLPAGILSFPLQVNLQAQEQSHGTGPASSVTLSGMSLTITDTSSGQNWDFVSSITVTIADGCNHPSMQVAQLNPVPKGQTTINLQPDGVNLIPYIQCSSGSTVTSTASGSVPMHDTTFDGQATFHVGF
jgi:hypothetical protein